MIYLRQAGRQDMKILTLYDGTIQAKTALHYGLRKARDTRGKLIVLQVFQGSLFLDYDAGPKAEEVARAEAARHRREAEEIISAANIAQDIPALVLSEEGDIIEEATRVAEREHADLILASPRHRALAKKASCPVYIMPGTILVPVDSSETPPAELDTVSSEAHATGSGVLVLGIVPVHLYSPAEQEELGQIEKRTAVRIKKMERLLKDRKIEVSVAIRSGYPDEEILKAADEFSVSLIMLPAGGKTPSELAKAAAIILDEPGRVRRPVLVLPAFES